MKNTREAETAALLERVNRHPRVKAALKGMMGVLPANIAGNLTQWVFRSIHEDDFLLFEQLGDSEGLFLDIGANRGHAAISVLRRTKRLQVLSLEPNPAMRSSLSLIRFLHPFRFRYRLVAAGAAPGKADLTIPLGDIDLSTQASLDRAEFAKEHVRERLAEFGNAGDADNFRQIRVTLCRVDDLNLTPGIVKIDVEGWEAQALEGMHQTLQQHMPVLMIEINNSPRWAPGLESLGYRFYSFQDGRLIYQTDWQKVSCLNVICMHPDSPSCLSQSLQELIQSGK